MNVLAIDPGYEVSAFVRFDGARVLDHGIEANAAILEILGSIQAEWVRTSIAPVVVIESIESFGMAVGRETFETVFWTGRFYQVVIADGGTCERMPRKTVKLHLCQSARAQDSNIRVAIVDRFGGKERAVGKKKTPGPLYGIKSHEWSALAIAITYWDHALASQRRTG